MDRLTPEQRLQIVEIFYKSNGSVRRTYRALRPFYGSHKRPSEGLIRVTVDRFRTTFSVNDKVRSVRRQTVRTEEAIAAVQQSIEEDPHLSIRIRSQQLGMSPSTLWKILRKDLGTYTSGASTSAAAAAPIAKSHSKYNYQQTPAISSGKAAVCKQSDSLTRQQKATLIKLQQEAQGKANKTSAGRRSNSSEIVSSPQDSKFGYGGTDAASSNTAQQSDEHSADADPDNLDEAAADESEVAGGEDYDQKKSANATSEEEQKTLNEEAVEDDEDDDDFNEEAGESEEVSENVDSESHHSSGATQSEIQDIQQNQIEPTSEENEGADGVSPSINTRSKATKSVTSNRRPHRGFHRGSNRPTPIIWHETPGNSRNTSPSHRPQQDQSGSPSRGGFGNQRGQRARRMRRPAGNFSTNRF